MESLQKSRLPFRKVLAARAENLEKGLKGLSGDENNGRLFKRAFYFLAQVGSYTPHP
jgi:hypothetical protein